MSTKAKDDYVNEIFGWLNSLNPKIQKNVPNIIKDDVLDIYDEDNKVAISFNMSYENSEYVLGVSGKKIFFNKTKKCREKGIKLVHLYEHLYLNKTNQIESFILAAFKLNKRSIYARSCKITHDIEKEFLKEYHIQGPPSSAMKYFNLTYKDEVVGVMTASKHHERGGDITACILSRLAFKRDVSVLGGSSKLFYSLRDWAKNNGYETILSWSDNSISNGDIYDTLKFNLDAEHAPSYFYLDKKAGVYRTKQSQRKTNKDRPDGMNIRDWNNTREVFAIWDCGKKKWSYKID